MVVYRRPQMLWLNPYQQPGWWKMYAGTAKTYRCLSTDVGKEVRFPTLLYRNAGAGQMERLL